MGRRERLTTGQLVGISRLVRKLLRASISPPSISINPIKRKPKKLEILKLLTPKADASNKSKEIRSRHVCLLEYRVSYSKLQSQSTLEIGKASSFEQTRLRQGSNYTRSISTLFEINHALSLGASSGPKHGWFSQGSRAEPDLLKRVVELKITSNVISSVIVWSARLTLNCWVFFQVITWHALTPASTTRKILPFAIDAIGNMN